MRIKVTRVLKGGAKPNQKYAEYPVEGVKELKQHKLSEFRTFAQKNKLIQDSDRFLRGDDETIDVDDEAVFDLAEFLNGSLQNDVLPKEAALTVWSQDYIDELGKPEEKTLSLTIKRKPEGLGDKSEKKYKVQDTAFNSMKLAELRTNLMALGYIAADDQFVDQGVVIETTKEADRDARSITDSDAITVWNKAEIDKLAAEEKEANRKKDWEARAPKIEVPQFSLVPPTVPGHEPARDHTRDAPQGFPGVTPRDGAQVYSQLKPEDMLAILTDSRLYPDPKGVPYCAALTVGDEIEFARDHIVSSKSIRTVGSPYSREDMIDFSYNEEVAKWQRQLVTEASVGANVPMVVGLSGKYVHQDARQTFKKNVEVCLTASIVLPKVRVILDHVSVSEEFTRAVEETLRARDPEELMRRLAASGHLVGTDFLLGGKLMCSTRKVLEEDYSAQKLGHEFSLAAQGSFDAEGVPVTLDAGAGWKDLTVQQKTSIRQKYQLKAKTFGGFGESSGSDPKKLGANWLATVRDSPRTWTVIGIIGEVRPSLSYLAPSLQNEAKTLLRAYFEDKLTVQQVVAGNTREKPWADDLTNVRRIAGVNFHTGSLVDGVQTVYDLNNDTQRTSPWHGESRKELRPDKSFKLEPGDEIAGIEVGFDNTVDHLIFWTKDGRRYPPAGQQYGGEKAKFTKLFNQPRIRGFYGMAAHYLDAFGVRYLELTKPLGSGVKKSALLSLERYIYS
jgi:hypothetical protein